LTAISGYYTFKIVWQRDLHEGRRRKAQIENRYCSLRPEKIPMKGERAFTLIEVLLSLALLGILAVVFLATFSTGSRVLISTDEQETAKNVAEGQMEYVQQQPYAASYPAAPIGTEYPGYSASISTSNITSRDGNIQRITVIITHHGEEAMRLEGFKARR
jgi:prepilin-type N-terminal cleavage/methylation domain-containing protein